MVRTNHLRRNILSTQPIIRKYKRQLPISFVQFVSISLRVGRSRKQRVDARSYVLTAEPNGVSTVMIGVTSVGEKSRWV